MDIYEKITDTIVSQIEAGAGKWQMPWHAGQGEFGELPTNADGRDYRGINTLILWFAQMDKGYDSNVWATYKMWSEKKAQVRKGEKATMVVFWSRIVDKKHKNENPDADPKMFLFAKAYFVFNAAQVDGYTPAEKPEIAPIGERIAAAESFFNNIPAKVNHGGNRAYYVPSADYIQMPEFNAFKSPEDYYSTRGHETIHFTGHKDRLNREFGKRFGDDAYAVEELVAELGAAFLCSYLGISNEPRPDHAQYLTNWLKVLTEDKRAIFTAASKAQASLDYLTKTTACEEEGEEMRLAA